MLLSALFILPLCLSGAFANKSQPFEKGADVPKLLKSLDKDAGRRTLKAAAGEPEGKWTTECAAVPASGETVPLTSLFRPAACSGKDCPEIKNSKTVAVHGEKAQATRACLNGTRFSAKPMRGPKARLLEAKLTVCRLKTIEGDDCVYSCSDGSSHRQPAAEPDPFDPDRPVIACPQIVIPF
ncbi:MAG: hypothetical protein V3S11_03200 [Elusimicrobiota bacterium]